MNSKSMESHLDFYKRWGALAKPYFKWQIQQFSGYIGGRIGDIGCGLGNFVEFFRDRELYVGFEPDEELAGEFGLAHKAGNVKLAAYGDVCTPQAVEEMKAHKLDTIICINVLEHIKDDELALSNMAGGISRNGHICIIVPAFASLYGSLDRLDGHWRRYSKRDLPRLTRNPTVEIVRCHYMNFLGGLAWFVKGRVLQEKTHANENYTITNRLLPLISLAERHVKPPFGLSMMMVLKKR
jgi:2-polyprenyl-3-methyl-5-hydroxy-6-metoxy-1,4-benzoquinol methylase